MPDTLTQSPAEHITEVAAGVFQVRLPLPFALNSVSCYLLRDGDGWLVLDTGLNTSRSRQLWEEAFAALEIAPGTVRRIVLTHTHPDHYGLAGWLQQYCRNGASGPPVYISPLEIVQAERVWKRLDEQIAHMEQYFVRCGLDASAAHTIAHETSKVGLRTRPHPEDVRSLAGGSELQVGARRFRVIHAPGHSDGQLIFYDAEDRLLLVGDHLLIKITPHIGAWPGAAANPLRNYLASLTELAALDVRLALPGHRALIHDWRGRLAEMHVHHAERLQLAFDSVGGGTTVNQVSRGVFRLGDLNVHESRFAIAETLAHLVLLVEQGRLRREDDHGTWRYYQTTSSE